MTVERNTRNENGSGDHAAEWHDRILDFIDGDLSSAESSLLLKHLESCEDCRGVHAQLSALHARLATELRTAPALSTQFPNRVFAAIETHEQTRAAAKLRAQRDFQKRSQAFELDWRSLWQRHFG